jgi:hypothetical protein
MGHYITSIEISYSIYLTTQLLKNYGYNKTNYQSFFTKSKIHNLKDNYFGKCCQNQKQPILLFEYIICRTILLLTNEFINSLQKNYQYNDDITTYLTLDNIKKIKLFEFIDIYIDDEIDKNFSYSCIDLIN